MFKNNKMHGIHKILDENQILNKYRKICGKKIVDDLCDRAKKISGKHILFISSTYHGGGVAEILNSIVFLFNIIGVKVGWRILNGNEDFFKVTKKFHNALQGENINLSKDKKKLYCTTNAKFAAITHLNHDLIVIHDPQPLPLIAFYQKKQPWIFRCHIDLSNPNHSLLTYLNKFIKQYDRLVFSKKEYQLPGISVPFSIIPPAIDPLAVKNLIFKKKMVEKYLFKHGILTNKPMIAQVSRFDKWKDPLGVIEVFTKVRQQHDCFLVLLGSLASDDPEGQEMYEKVLHAARTNQYANDIKVILVSSDILVNCVQRAATVIIQKSLREGFGLVVSEALLKGTPVVASKVGGISLQIIDGFNGFLVDPYDIDGFSNKVIAILKNKALRKRLSKNAIQYVKNNFLITRLMSDWMNVFEFYFKNYPAECVREKIEVEVLDDVIP